MSSPVRAVPGRLRVIGLRLMRWANAHPAGSAALGLLLAFGTYLFSQQPIQFYYDAGLYWDLSLKYWENGEFRLLAFDNNLRGYLFPLLLASLYQTLLHTPAMPFDITRGLGALCAALLFGVVAPGLWQAASKTPATSRVPLGQRLLFGLLSFAFWRGYFHYPLTDFPSLLALTSALWGVVRGRSVTSGLVAGALVAAAINFRPVYLAALPVAFLLNFWTSPGEARGQRKPLVEWSRRLAFVLGVGLMLWPQALINKTHFGVASPLVLTTKPGTPSLYLSQLKWGLWYQKYETNVGTQYPVPSMFFLDNDGRALWNSTGLIEIDSYATYGKLAQDAPATVAGVWLRHLFNGLDLQYPMPYIEAVYVPTWGLAWLNYTVLLAGLAVLAFRFQRGSTRAFLVAFALLLPCAAVVPVAMECRFMLPLHLLLCAAVAFEAQFWCAWLASSWRTRAVCAAVYVAAVLGCFVVSSSNQSHLELGPKVVFGSQPPPPVPW